MLPAEYQLKGSMPHRKSAASLPPPSLPPPTATGLRSSSASPAAAGATGAVAMLKREAPTAASSPLAAVVQQKSHLAKPSHVGPISILEMFDSRHMRQPGATSATAAPTVAVSQVQQLDFPLAPTRNVNIPQRTHLAQVYSCPSLEANGLGVPVMNGSDVHLALCR